MPTNLRSYQVACVVLFKSLMVIHTIRSAFPTLDLWNDNSGRAKIINCMRRRSSGQQLVGINDSNS